MPEKSELSLEELPFVQLRRSLFESNDLVAIKRQQDRTTKLILRVDILQETIPKIRSSTLSCCEAVEGKNGAVAIRIFDEQKWANLQESLKTFNTDLVACEAAIRELDSFAATDYLEALLDTRSNLSGTERTLQNMLSAEAQAAIARGRQRGQFVDDALATDQIYCRKKKLAEDQTARAKKALASVNERIKRIDNILSSVGC